VNIRALTAFVDLASPLDDVVIARAGALISRARDALEGAGFTVQTMRLASQPVAEIIPSSQIGASPDFAHDVEAAIKRHGLGYASLGMVRLGDSAQYVAAISSVLQATEVISASLEIANPSTGIDLSRIQEAAQVISQAGRLTDDGFANLRLAALANVRPYAPFFPAAYHGGGAIRFAIATESADIAVGAVSSANSLAEARSNLIGAIESHAQRMEAVVQNVIDGDSRLFAGIDFSLAPFPDEARSIGISLEKLGLPTLGAPGSVFAAAFLTDAVDRAQFTRTGFCGLMMPVMEDTLLARRASESHLHVADLLMYSAVCGTGLDTIPLPGDVTDSELAAILLDVAGLALRLDKQLTARLLPLPGKKAGDLFDTAIEFFAPSRVLDVARGGLTGLLAGTETLDLLPRHSTRQAAAR
jgi:uncharacterized protein